MMTIEVRLMENGRELSLDALVDLLAERAARRIGQDIRERTVTYCRDSQSSSPTSRKASDTQPKAVSVQEAARILSVSEAALRKFIGRKRLRAIHVGARVLIPMEVIDAALRDGIPK